VQLGIRHVACIPLRMVRYLDRADMKAETKNIGVLYLDSREKGSLLAPHTRTALDTASGFSRGTDIAEWRRIFEPTGRT